MNLSANDIETSNESNEMINKIKNWISQERKRFINKDFTHKEQLKSICEEIESINDAISFVHEDFTNKEQSKLICEEIKKKKKERKEQPKSKYEEIESIESIKEFRCNMSTFRQWKYKNEFINEKIENWILKESDEFANIDYLYEDVEDYYVYEKNPKFNKEIKNMCDKIAKCLFDEIEDCVFKENNELTNDEQKKIENLIFKEIINILNVSNELNKYDNDILECNIHEKIENFILKKRIEIINDYENIKDLALKQMKNWLSIEKNEFIEDYKYIKKIKNWILKEKNEFMKKKISDLILKEIYEYDNFKMNMEHKESEYILSLKKFGTGVYKKLINNFINLYETKQLEKYKNQFIIFHCDGIVQGEQSFLSLNNAFDCQDEYKLPGMVMFVGPNHPDHNVCY